MGLFHPVSKQYEVLSRYLSIFPAIDLAFAASKMQIKPGRVARSLAVMNKRAYFAPHTVYLDPDLSLVVLDRCYESLARAFKAANRIANHLNFAQNTLANRPSSAAPGVRSRVFRSFIRDFADSALHKDTGEFIRSRGADYLREILDPTAARTAAENVQTALLPILADLEETNNAFLAFVREHTRVNYAGAASFLDSLCYQTELLCGSLSSYSNGNSVRGQEARSLIERLGQDHLPRYRDLLLSLQSAAQKKPGSSPLARELEQQAARLATLSGQVPSKKMAQSLQTLSALMQEVRYRIEIDAGKASPGSLRSLENVYLPMISELLGKYMQSAAMHTEQAALARSRTEEVFADTLPQAFREILRDLEDGSANDMQAQADALIKKMKLDGLLPYNS